MRLGETKAPGARQRYLAFLLLVLVVVGHIQIYAAMTATIALTECSVVLPVQEETGPLLKRPAMVPKRQALNGPADSGSQAIRDSRAIWGGNVNAPRPNAGRDRISVSEPAMTAPHGK